jgi:serine/threonine protein kinase
MTGRSCFASGAGTAEDNRLTLEGRVAFPRGYFSPAAKDFVSRLCTVDPTKRLGAGPQGWRDVMAHPFFHGLDWSLLDARVLPPPAVPPYVISLEWTRVPPKIENHVQQDPTADRDAAAGLELTAEEEAIFRACCFVSPL